MNTRLDYNLDTHTLSANTSELIWVVQMTRGTHSHKKVAGSYKLHLHQVLPV